MLTEAGHDFSGRDRADRTSLGHSEVGAAAGGRLLRGTPPEYQKEACNLAVTGRPSKDHLFGSILLCKVCQRALLFGEYYANLLFIVERDFYFV